VYVIYQVMLVGIEYCQSKAIHPVLGENGIDAVTLPSITNGSFRPLNTQGPTSYVVMIRKFEKISPVDWSLTRVVFLV